MIEKHHAPIVYFEREGRENLGEVIRIIKRTMKKRPELQKLKLVVFTAAGEGAWLAYNCLNNMDVVIIAVTFPLDFSIKRETEQHFPRIPGKVRKFFDGVGIRVVAPGPLALDSIEGMDQHNQQVKTVRDAITIFGGGLVLCVQAVLRACDSGAVESGERVIAAAGDCAAIITASTTRKFLSSEGIAVHEILCKARNLTIARPKAVKLSEPVQGVLPAMADDRKTLTGATEEAKK